MPDVEMGVRACWELGSSWSSATRGLDHAWAGAVVGPSRELGLCMGGLSSTFLDARPPWPEAYASAFMATVRCSAFWPWLELGDALTLGMLLSFDLIRGEEGLLLFQSWAWNDDSLLKLGDGESSHGLCLHGGSYELGLELVADRVEDDHAPT
ncbi:hypothetical protein Dimus_012161 [Dionaea muscipula]